MAGLFTSLEIKAEAKRLLEALYHGRGLCGRGEART